MGDARTSWSPVPWSASLLIAGERAAEERQHVNVTTIFTWPLARAAGAGARRANAAVLRASMRKGLPFESRVWNRFQCRAGHYLTPCAEIKRDARRTGLAAADRRRAHVPAPPLGREYWTSRSGPAAHDVVLEPDRTGLLVDALRAQPEHRPGGRWRQERNAAAEQHGMSPASMRSTRPASRRLRKSSPAAEDRDVLPRLRSQLGDDAFRVGLDPDTVNGSSWTGLIDVVDW
jgi:hypothetical protein